MPHKVRIALDAMGGDHGPSVVVPGAELSLGRHPDIEFVLFGDRAVIEPLLDGASALQGRRAPRPHRRRGQDGRQAEPGAAPRPLEVLDVARDRRGEEGRGGCRRLGRQYRRADGDGEVQPADHGRASSARRSPRSGRRCAANRSCSIVGATIGADAAHLVDLAVMGSAMARVLFDLERPTVGLLNIGVEEVKGLEAGARGRPHPARGDSCRIIDYVGFVEGDDIGKGTVDVVVTEGFAGNIALKTAEGTATPDRRLSAQRHAPHVLRARLGYLLARDAFRTLARQDGPAQGQWRRLPRPQRHRHQEPRRHRRRGLRHRDRPRLRHGAPRTARQDRPDAAPSTQRDAAPHAPARGAAS